MVADAARINNSDYGTSLLPVLSQQSQQQQRPLTIGIFGGSFNPIHLGHTLLAITTYQTKPVDQVVLVPVYKHAVKRDLLPFDDRVQMCQLAIQGNGNNIIVSTIERDVGESNGAMIRGLKQQYPPETKFVWICGDDFFRWMHKPKGLETLQEVSGLIVQRRLHRTQNNDSNLEDQRHFFKEPIDHVKVQEISIKMNLHIDYIYGELPHFSSTLVRRAPGNWKSFLTQSVSKYIDERQHLLQQLVDNLEADAKKEEQEQDIADKKKEQISKLHRRTQSTIQTYSQATLVIMRGLELVHLLQYERGYTGLALSIGNIEQIKNLKDAQNNTDALIKEVLDDEDKYNNELDDGLDEVLSLANELKRIPLWLNMDRQVLEKRFNELLTISGIDGWLARLAIVEKFNSRIDVLIGAIVRSLTEILVMSTKKSMAGENENSTTDHNSNLYNIPELLYTWSDAKEALGRQRAFVCSGGTNVPTLVRNSLKLRQRLINTINTKERCIERVLTLEAEDISSSRLAAPDALHRMLEHVTLLEYTLMGCFASSTPIHLVHKLMGRINSTNDDNNEFDVVKFFDASTAAIDFLLSFAKALAASACASA